MIEREGQIDHVGRAHLTMFIEDGPLYDLTDSQDANLRVMNDRRGKQAADAADRRDRERAAHELVTFELTRPCAGGEPLDRARQVHEAQLVRTANHGHDKSSGRGDGDADVVVGV